MAAQDDFNAETFLRELLARFPETARIESGAASYRWLSAHAADLEFHENTELPANQVVLLDAEGKHRVTVDVVELRGGS